jgi:NAD dependent epimerase/dehydratase family enzyme
MLQLLLGEMAIMVTEGSAISAEKTTQIPFQFKFPEIEGALKDLLS